MSVVKKLAKNTILLVSTNFISLILGFILNVYIARYLGADDFGIFNAALNLSLLFTIITDFGISTYLTMQISREPVELKPYLNNALSIKIIMVILAYGGILLTAYAGNYTGAKLVVVMIVGLYVMLTAISQIFQSSFQALQSMEHIAVCQILNPLILLIGTGYVIFFGKGVVSFALVYLISGIAVLGYYLIVIILSGYIPIPSFNINKWKMLFFGGIPFSMNTLFYFIFFRIDIQLIDFLLGSKAVGFYSAAFKLIDAILCIPSMYCMAVFPIISSLYHKKDPKINLLLDRSIKYLLLLGAPICIGTFLLADKFIYLFYQDKFIPSIEVLQILALGMLVSTVNAVPSNILIGTNLQKASIKIYMFAAFINIILNILIIPVYGITGSAWTMVVTQLVVFIITYYLLKREGYRYPGISDIARITVCSLIMGIVVYFLHGQNLLITVISGAIVYGILMVVSGAISKQDISIIKEIFRKNDRPSS
jgi:O-antigen/teichoic acid export membrane protein